MRPLFAKQITEDGLGADRGEDDVGSRRVDRCGRRKVGISTGFARQPEHDRVVAPAGKRCRLGSHQHRFVELLDRLGADVELLILGLQFVLR